ncbi:hypothetical protein K438DRAFT_1764439 [Mycena galopus ATCC 62051]|nr:hypothetical protein K438DRAFT_1764439 [Mycena galopus ATCC 62051]
MKAKLKHRTPTEERRERARSRRRRRRERKRFGFVGGGVKTESKVQAIVGVGDGRGEHAPVLARPPQAAGCLSMCGEEAGARGGIGARGRERLARAVHDADGAFGERVVLVRRLRRELHASGPQYVHSELRAEKSDAVSEGGRWDESEEQADADSDEGGCGMVEEEESGGGTDERERGGAGVGVLLRRGGRPREESNVLGKRRRRTMSAAVRFLNFFSSRHSREEQVAPDWIATRVDYVDDVDLCAKRERGRVGVERATLSEGEGPGARARGRKPGNAKSMAEFSPGKSRMGDRPPVRAAFDSASAQYKPLSFFRSVKVPHWAERLQNNEHNSPPMSWSVGGPFYFCLPANKALRGEAFGLFKILNYHLYMRGYSIPSGGLHHIQIERMEPLTLPCNMTMLSTLTIKLNISEMPEIIADHWTSAYQTKKMYTSRWVSAMRKSTGAPSATHRITSMLSWYWMGSIPGRGIRLFYIAPA